jgi:hypothetical protein
MAVKLMLHSQPQPAIRRGGRCGGFDHSSRWLGVMLEMAKHLSQRMKFAPKSLDELTVDARPQGRHWKVMDLIRLASVRYCT